MGDNNCDYLKTDSHRHIKDLFITHGYKQLINKATRITETSESLIDIILTNSPETIRKHDTILSSESDHDIIALIRKKYSYKYTPNVVNSRNYKNYDVNRIRDEMKTVNWQNVKDCHDSNLCWLLIKNVLTKCIDTYAPITNKTVKGKPIPWLTDQIKKQMNDRDKLLRKARKSKNADDWKNYKTIKNRTNNMINKAKTKYHKEILNENTSKPEKFWRHIKTLFPTKPTNQCSKNFVINNQQTTDEKMIANGSVPSSIKLLKISK